VLVVMVRKQLIMIIAITMILSTRVIALNTVIKCYAS